MKPSKKTAMSTRRTSTSKTAPKKTPKRAAAKATKPAKKVASKTATRPAAPVSKRVAPKTAPAAPSVRTSTPEAKRLATRAITARGVTIPASEVKPGDRFRGVKDGVQTDYITAKVGPGADPIVAFFIPDKHSKPTTRTTVTKIRLSGFLRDYSAKRLPLPEGLDAQLALSPREKAARTDRH